MTIRVPALEVDAFAGGVVGDQHQQVLVLHEALDNLAALLARHAAVDHVHRFGVAQARAHLFQQVVERVLRLGEDDQLAAIAGGVDHQLVVEDAIELGPFRIDARAQNAQGHRSPGPSASRLPARVAQPSRRRRAGGDQVLKLVDFLLPILLDIAEHVGIDRRLVDPRPPTFGGKPRFAQARSSSLSRRRFKRLVDCCGRRGEAPLQDLQSKTDVVALLVVAFGEALHAVHLVAHVFGDSGV